MLPFLTVIVDPVPAEIDSVKVFGVAVLTTLTAAVTVCLLPLVKVEPFTVWVLRLYPVEAENVMVNSSP